MSASSSGPAYVVHGAVISCSCGLRPSHVVVPISHGSFIHNIAQLTVSDYLPNTNVQNFGGCTSSQNPSVQAAAESVVKSVNEESKGFFDKVMGFFCKKDKAADESFVSQCVGSCTPVIVAPWDNGKVTVQLDGSKPLLSTGTLTCIYGGVITIQDTGQPE